ncbi:hypothetical protein HK405_015335 [Cladochytrium tenue]|nr:hypothetical protein HK405_015335 [Cladochytrium tenue]
MSEVQRSRTSPSPTGGAAGAPGGGPRRAAAASTTPVVSTVRGDRSDSAPRPRHDQAGSKNDYDDNDNDAPSTFGPSLPRHLVRSREGAARDHSEGDDDDDDAGSAAAFGPALPPHLVRNRASDSSGGQRNGNSSSSVGGNGATAARDEGRVYGPARPPQKPVTSAPAISVEPAADPPRRRRQAMGPAAGPPPGFATASGSAQETRGGGTDEDNDDDGFGPKPLPSGAEGILEDLERQERLAAIEARASRSGGAEAADGRDSAARKGGREEWMLVPPAPNRLGVGGPDMKSRTFSMSTRPKEVDQSGWTALPG